MGIRRDVYSHVIQIEPNDFRKPSRAALQDNINEKYANKVIPHIGLCLAFYDLLRASDGLIGHGTGTVNINATFRLLIFRPFAGELIEGKIIRSTRAGIRVGVDFFDDIFVPAPSALFEPSHLEVERGSGQGDDADALGKEVSTWVWTNDGTPYYFDKNERVRFRVEDEVWKDQAPGLKEAMGQTTGIGVKVEDGGRVLGDGEMEKARADKSPWRIVGSMQQGGLGVVSWWMDVEGEGGEEVEAEAGQTEDAVQQD